MRAARTDEWGVLLKVAVRGAGPGPTDEQLAQVLAALPGRDKRLTGFGTDFTVWSWIEATDASAAVDALAERVRAAAAAVGIGRLQFIRAHSASVEGRASPFLGIRERVDRYDTWSVYFRVACPPGGDAVGDEALDRIVAALAKPDVRASFGGDREKFLMNDGTGIVVRFWADGTNPGETYRAARSDLLEALEASGLGSWSIVRMQASTAERRSSDSFPGLESRQPRTTEETR